MCKNNHVSYLWIGFVQRYTFNNQPAIGSGTSHTSPEVDLLQAFEDALNYHLSFPKELVCFSCGDRISFSPWHLLVNFRLFAALRSQGFLGFQWLSRSSFPSGFESSETETNLSGSPPRSQGAGHMGHSFVSNLRGKTS